MFHLNKIYQELEPEIVQKWFVDHVQTISKEEQGLLNPYPESQLTEENVIYIIRQCTRVDDFPKYPDII
jgi:hypothetical protein